jgi:hypothetical protein
MEAAAEGLFALFGCDYKEGQPVRRSSNSAASHPDNESR